MLYLKLYYAMKYIRLFEDFQLGDLNVMSPEEIKKLFFKECSKAIPDLELIRVIIENGLVDVNDAKEIGGFTPLHRVDSVELAKLLIASGADVRAKDTYDRTPLHDAADIDNIELAKLLIVSGANVNTKDKFGNTPLHFAVERDSIAIAKLLIASGADVNVKDGWGDSTPLHRAVERDRIELAKLLIDSGAKVNARNVNDRTPLHWANSDEMIALLKQNGATL